MVYSPSFCKACWFLKMISSEIYKLFRKIWQISTWLSPQRYVSTFLGTFLHTCPELQAFIFFFFIFSLLYNQGQVFNWQSRSADWGLLSQWELLPEACIELHCSQLCCHSQFLGPHSQLGESTQGHQKSDCQESLSFVSSEQLPHGLPFPLSSDVPASLLLLPSLIRAYHRKASHCLELLEKQSTAASSSCLSIRIIVAQQQCSVHHRHWAWLLLASKTHYTLPSCVSSSLISPSIPLVTRTGALSFLVFKCRHCSRPCRPRPRAWQLSSGQGGTVGRGWTAKESKGMSLKAGLQCLEIGKRKAVTNTESDRLQTLTSENPDLSHGGESCCAAAPTSLTRLTNNNN